jgi:hypothetical protein
VLAITVFDFPIRLRIADHSIETAQQASLGFLASVFARMFSGMYPMRSA